MITLLCQLAYLHSITVNFDERFRYNQFIEDNEDFTLDIYISQNYEDYGENYYTRKVKGMHGYETTGWVECRKKP